GGSPRCGLGGAQAVGAVGVGEGVVVGVGDLAGFLAGTPAGGAPPHVVVARAGPVPEDVVVAVAVEVAGEGVAVGAVDRDRGGGGAPGRPGVAAPPVVSGA